MAETRKLKIGVLMGDDISQGGAFVQSINIAKMLTPADGDDFTVEYLTIDRAVAGDLREMGLEVHAQTSLFGRQIDLFLRRFPYAVQLARMLYRALPIRSLDRLAATRGYDLLIFTAPSRQALNLNKTPFVCTIWDVGHREHPEFPEISLDGSYEWREHIYRNVLPRASGIIVDGPATASRLAHFYGIDPSRAIIVPHEISPKLLNGPDDPSLLAKLREQHNLSGPFVFYPAQFWAHKNHVYILNALKFLRVDRGIEISAVFAGSDKGNLAHVRTIAMRLGVSDLAKFVGFLDIRQIAQLYREATALVMPSYFGPTNIPPIEAAAFGCPVIYSDLPGYRQFAGPSAFYCDLTEPASLGLCIEHVLTIPRPVPHLPVLNEGREALRLFMRQMLAKIVTWRDLESHYRG